MGPTLGRARAGRAEVGAHYSAEVAKTSTKDRAAAEAATPETVTTAFSDSPRTERSLP